jgi:hypothetical protein
MTDNQTLLSRYCPVYNTDHKERIFPVSLEKYVSSKECIADGTVAGYVVDKLGGVKHLHYFLYFSADGGLEVFEVVFDDHLYDIEHMIVETNAQGSVTGVLYQPHASREHFWIRHTADLQKILSGGQHPLVFVSRGKHGLYPLSGTILRFFGVASDQCERPVKQAYRAVEASDNLMSTLKIDGVFPGLPSRLTAAVDKKPVVRLGDVRSRLLFKFW